MLILNIIGEELKVMIEIIILHILKNIPSSFAYKVVSINDSFSKKVVLYRRENAIFRLIGKRLEEYEY